MKPNIFFKETGFKIGGWYVLYLTKDYFAELFFKLKKLFKELKYGKSPNSL